MAGTRNQCRLLPSRVAEGFLPKPPSRVLVDLVAIAENQQTISDLSRMLFLGLRKQIGTPDLLASLMGIQYLGFKGDVAGVRLLAAYLDMTTAGARLIPHVRNFNNTRRQQLFLDGLIGELDNSAKDWQNRASRLSGLCMTFHLNSSPQENESRWCRMGLVMGQLLTDVITGHGISAANRILLADLLRLETDAWEERIGRLAGMVNPFKVSSVQRVLPLLSRADVNIRDLRQLVSWVEEGQDQKAFTQQGFRALEVLEENEFNQIYQAMKDEMKLQVLAGLHRGGRDNPLVIEKLSSAVAGLMTLHGRVQAAEGKEYRLDHLSAIALAQQYYRGEDLALPIDQEQEFFLQEILSDLKSESSGDGSSDDEALDIFTLKAGQLFLKLGSGSWPNGLPVVGDFEPNHPKDSANEDEGSVENEEKKEDLDASAIKHLVMSNIMSVSVLLGFLRNPKVISIPGLVADVANRTRNPQIIETIARDRALYSGFAVREVPLACLRSPCNVPPKTLRKFIHVKFVSKIDLKRMANDKTGIRKEIVREINIYLNNLS